MDGHIIYSSLTGNTQKLAEQIKNRVVQVKSIHNIKNITEIPPEGVLIICYWNSRGTADPLTLKLLETIHNRTIITAGTLGAYPDSDHAKRMMQRVQEECEKNNNKVLGSFCCQGKIDVRRTIKRLEILEGQPHYLDREGIKRHLTSHLHPDEKDFEQASSLISSLLEAQKDS